MSLGNIKFLRKIDVIYLYKKIMKEYGGEMGIRDESLLESALAQPKNEYYYNNAGIYRLAASYCFSICKNHPFIDGNKRISYVSMRTFLMKNNCDIKCSQEKKINIVLDIANDKADKDDLVDFIKKHSISI